MNKINKFGFLAVICMLLGCVSAQAQTVVHNKAYYDAITYEWTDADGSSYTNSITEVATNPYQIVALLKKVYCDPNIPGPKYSAWDANGRRERQVYYGAVTGGWNIAASDVIAPYEDGYTPLIVSVKNELNLYDGDTPQQSGGWWPTTNTYSSNFFTSTQELIDYVSDNIASVQLLTDGLRIGSGEKAGTAFNINGNYNRFFILGKGQARQKDSYVTNYENNNGVIAGERVPFKSMFEQFSPTDGSEGSEITDFYARMIDGDIYSVVHDCASVIQVEHYFSMAGKAGTEPKSLTGLNFFIPDYRLKYWETTVESGGWWSTTYTLDGRTMNPYKDITGYSYGDASYLTANYAQYNATYAPLVGIYTITLDANAAVAEQEHTYNVVLDWTSSLNNMAGETVPQSYTVYIVLTNEDGEEINDELVVTGETTYTYQVPQNEHSYTITYVVKGVPADGEHDMFIAWSNQSSVIIPGWNDFLSLALDHYESDYVIDGEKNYYRNFLVAENNDIANALTIGDIAEGLNELTLYRFDTENPDVKTAVAVLTLTTTSRGNVNYSIAYDEQEILNGYALNELGIATQGNLGNFDEQEPIDLSEIMFVDQFTAVTAENEHPNRYGYVLATNGKSSNDIEVPVMKTTQSLDGFYTLEEVMNDTEAQLPTFIKNANVEMNLSTNPGVYYYTLTRGDNAMPTENISKQQRRTDGTYIEMLDVLPQYFNTVAEPGIVNRLDDNILTGNIGDFTAYQPVVWTFGSDRVKHDGENSYGSPVWKTGVADIAVDVHGIRSESEWGTWKDENGQWCNIFNPIITVTGMLPEGQSIDYEPFMYRVWRLCDDVRGYNTDPETGKYRNDETADRSANALICEEQTDEASVTFGSEENEEYAFGALSSTSIKFLARFYYVKAGEAQNDGPMYYVVDKLVDWTNMVTGIDEINAAGEVSKTYFNAQGLESNVPFDGVNIVVTRYSDGSTKTSKVVK